MNGFAHLVGWLCITTFMICLACRVYFGPDAINRTPGRMFALFGELLECMAHHVLEWYGERKIMRSNTGMVNERSALPRKTNRASGMLSRWQFPGASTSTSDFFRALFPISLLRFQLSLLVIVIFVTSVAA